jgi:molecular chaperone Hsp33
MLISLGREEVDSIIEEMKLVTVTCDFCNRQYSFDVVDIAQLFRSGDTATDPQSTRH